MNVIKAYYIRMFAPQYQNLPNVFHWRLETIPSEERVGSVTFLVNFTTAVLDSLCLAAAVFFGYTILFVPAGLEKIDSESLIIGLLAAGVAFVLAAIFQVLYYRSAFDKRKEMRKLRLEEEKVAQVRLVNEA